METKLKRWMKAQGMTVNRLASALGLCRSWTSHILAGSKCGIDVMVRIEKLTKGAVTIADMLQYRKEHKKEGKE